MTIMPNPVVDRPRRISYVEVLGRIWRPPIKVGQTYELSDYDLENVGEFTREAFAHWLATHAGDFEQVIDFHVGVGNSEIPWHSEDNESEFYQCMYLVAEFEGS